MTAPAPDLGERLHRVDAGSRWHVPAVGDRRIADFRGSDDGAGAPG